MSKAPDAFRVLIVDDSAVIRGALGSIVDSEHDMMVVTTANTGRVALDALKHLKIDVVLLDIEMPEMDGLTALPLILEGYPQTRVIMASSLTQKGAEVTLTALAMGASDFIAKPAAKSGSGSLATLHVEITSKIRAIGYAARAGHSSVPRSTTTRRPTPLRTELLSARTGDAPPRILAIAASTGGPNALAAVLSGLPNDFPLPIVVTQHMPAVFTQMLAQRLERDAGRPCVEARDGDRLVPGRTYIAPGDYHMIVHTHEGYPFVKLTQTEPENYCRPAADAMFRSVASIYGASTLAVVLTGMGEDGMRGCREIAARGGRIIVQDEASSVVWGMPGAVVRDGISATVLPLDDVAAAVVHIVHGRKLSSGAVAA